MPERLSILKWPQPLELIAGEKRQFVFPLTTEGKMEGQIRWEGPPLDVRLYRPDGSEALALQNQLPPCASLQWETGRPVRGQLPLWKLSVQLSGAGRADPAQGEVYLALPRLLRSQERTLMDQIRDQGLVLDDRLEDLLEKVREDLLLAPPVLLRVVPAEGIAGAHVTLIGQNFTQNIDCVTAGFWCNEWGGTSAARIDLFKENGEDHLVVEVPLRYKNIFVPISGPGFLNGHVWVERTTAGGTVLTPSMSFRFLPAHEPRLTAILPNQVSAGQLVTGQGRDFGLNPQELAVEFALNGATFPAPVQTITDTQFTVQVPAYTAHDNTPGEVRVKRLYPFGWVPDPFPAPITFHSTIPVVHAYNAYDIYPDAHTLSPLGTLEISGTGFGNTPGKVYINLLPGQNPGEQVIWLPNMEMEVISWSDTSIEARLWDNDYLPFEAEFQIATSDANGPSQQTGWEGLHVEPVYETKYIHFCNPYVEAHQPSAWTGTPDDEWSQLASGTGIQVIHRAGFFHGHSDDDLFFRNFPPLQNFFKVDLVTLTKILANPGEADAYLVESHPGTNNPSVKVHWWNSPSNNHVIYTLSIRLKGPRGHDYQ